MISSRQFLATLCYLLALATSASAEEPRGFLDWPWGATYETIAKDQSWCRSREKFLEGTKTITCHLYFVGDIPITSLILNFQPHDALSGYTMCFASSSYGAMRDVSIVKFGPPTSTIPLQQSTTPGGASISVEWLGWKWPSGTVAFLAENRMLDVPSCLSVSTKALSDMRGKKEEEQKEQRKKGF
jgi:hypothetical protein